MNAVTIFDPQTIPTIERLAKSMAASNMFGVKSPEAALAVMLMAQADGLHPAKAMQEYHVIEGRPALKADAMLARFLSAGGRLEYHESSEELCDVTFSHPQAGSLRVRWDMNRARKAGLADRPQWKKYPAQMLRARAVSEGVRAVFPGVAVGSYTVEEAQDMALDVKDAPQVTEAVIVDVTPRRLPESELADYLAAIEAAADLTDLKRQFDTAYSAAKRVTDQAAIDAIRAAKDARKAALTVEDVA